MNRHHSVSRRTALAALLAAIPAASQPLNARSRQARPDEPFRIRNKRIHQSVMGWCFKPMTVPVLIDHCVEIGLEGIEGIDRKFYPLARSKGLQISLVGSHGFAAGPVDRSNHEACEQALTSAIEAAVQFEAKRVITFTGMSVRGMSDATAENNCLELWRRVISYAEQHDITLCLEHLNSKDDSHPMKGHPGYFGDDVERCFDLVRRMDSPNFKLLFDVYHVQIMNGDVIRRIRQNHSLIGHYHTAGNPGRRELDQLQEINYPAVMQAILDTGYSDFVAQEFIPTWDDPVKSLRHAAEICDI